MKKVFLLILIILVFALGVYFSHNVVLFLGGLNKNIQDFQKTDLGSLIKQVGSEVLNPAPLKINNPFRDVTLTVDKVFLETNAQRNANNLPSLKRNEILNKAALAKANDMFKNQYFEHNSPLGVTPAQLVKSFGYNYIVTGENLILGNFASEKELVRAWMDSPGHRENILNKRYSEVGIAVVKGVYKGETVWIGVQEFGLPLSSCKEPDAILKNEIDAKKIELDNLSFAIDQKRDQISSAKNDRAKYNMLVEEYNFLVERYQNLSSQVKNLVSNYNSQVNVFNQCVSG